jgi:hypothetical protein
MLAEQIATLETNYADAQAKVTAQNSSIETLTVSVAALTKDKLLLEAERADLQKRVADLETHNDETMAAVEKLANAALDMLRVAQRPPGMPAAVIQFAPKPKTVVTTATAARDIGVLVTDDMLKLPDPPAQAAVTDIMTGDTGDEQPALQPAPAPQPELPAAAQPDAPAAAPIPTNDAPAAPSADAMSRINSTAARALPDNVMQSDGPLPAFLQRDTVFQREGGNILA